MRRCIAIVLFFLLLGVVANVAVAWSIAMWSPIELVGWDSAADDQLWWERNLPAGTPERVRYSWRYTGIGADWRMMGFFDDTFEFSWLAVHEIRTGVPMRSLDGFVMRSISRMRGFPVFGRATQPMDFADERWGAFELDRPAMLGGSSYRLIPYRPMWPGFAVNTIFYAIVLWLVLAMPRALRRRLRIRRGQCPACAYPTGTSPVCTECGAAVSAMRVEA